MADAGPPFRLGRVIGRSFLIWLRHLPLLFALVLVVNVPYIAWDTYKAVAAKPAEFDERDVPPADPSFTEMVAYLAPEILRYGRQLLVHGLFVRLAQAAVIFAVYRRLRGERPSFRGSLRGGFHRFAPVLRVALALLAIEFVLNVILGVAYYVMLFRSDFAEYDFFFYFALALHALMLLLVTPFWVAVPAAVVDRDRSCLVRSWSLTRGFRVRVFAVLLLVAAIGYARRYLLWPLTTDLGFAARQTVTWAQELLVDSFAAVLAVVGYRALRLNKEGLDVTTLEEIFA